MSEQRLDVSPEVIRAWARTCERLFASRTYGPKRWTLLKVGRFRLVLTLHSRPGRDEIAKAKAE